MLAFFRGWKRKVGVMTLVTASVIAGLFVQSGSYVDKLAIYP